MVEKAPGFFDALWFKFRTQVLIILHYLRPGRRVARIKPSRHPGFTVLQNIKVTSGLWNHDQVPAEKILEAGKVHNLRIAAKNFAGLNLKAGHILSFWAQVGPPSRLRGYVKGRELREGCLVASIGGGLCQLSNALYEAGLKAGLEVVERHAHTQSVPGSKAEQGLDATVFHNYVDLRLRATSDSFIEVKLNSRDLLVTIKTSEPKVSQLNQTNPTKSLKALPIIPNSCASCGRLDCGHNVEIELNQMKTGQTAYLFDEYWPEFDFLLDDAKDGDYIHLPLNGQRRKKANYAWKIPRRLAVFEAPLFAFRRSLASRRLRAQGAERQKSLLTYEKKLAKIMARRLGPQVTRLVVAQTLLPHLYELGACGGREVIVCVNRPPLFILQEKLDLALANNSHSQTLGDYRAPVDFVEAEKTCLEEAHEIITPHVLLASYFEKLRLVPWLGQQGGQPRSKTHNSKPRLGFLGPTLGRKGAFEAREIMRRVGEDFDILVFGPLMERGDFWDSLKVERRSRASAQNMADLDVIIAPSYIENSPRHLIEALNQGIYVIGTLACGLPAQDGLVVIDSPDPDQFELALKAYLVSNK